MKNKPLHFWLPDWANDSFKAKKCSRCQISYQKKDIVAIGVRESDNKTCLYVEHVCSGCEYRVITTIGRNQQKTLEGMCFDILESIKRKRISHNTSFLRKKGNTNKMTDKEVKGFLATLNKTTSHEEFLKEIGAKYPEKKDDDTS